MNENKLAALVSLSASLIAFLTCALPAAAGGGPRASGPPQSSGLVRNAEGPIMEAQVVTGTFDIHRKYRSMEGPFVNQDLRVGELLLSKHVRLPDSLVHFVEKDSEAPAMMGGRPDSSSVNDRETQGLVRRRGEKRELYWFKGIKLTVLDETDLPLPTAEFICHFNLDIDPAKRNELFPQGERTINTRLISLTQGQTELYFPEGFGVPVASDEVWRFGFQAANRTTDKHRRLKHRCTVYFITDSELAQPVKALHWHVPYCTVVVDRDTPKAALAAHQAGPSCLSSSPGVLAPNRGSHLSLLTDSQGRRLSGHWVVPPGKHTYSSEIVDERDPGFAQKDRRIHALWTHLHPLCVSTSLVECNGKSRRKLYAVNIKTKTAGGLEIKHIDAVSSRAGIPLSAGRRYELEGTYLNGTGVPQDSMISHGIFFAEESFAKPAWVTSPVSEDDAVIATKHGATQKDAEGDKLRLFNPSADGPLLSGDKIMELETSAGKVRIVLEPHLAPQHATQMYRLLARGAYDGTPVFQYHPNFLLQMGSADYKIEGQPALKEELKQLLRRLPLEIAAQPGLLHPHQRWALSMSRDAASDSAVSSFCVMLNEASQLDAKYTVFGHVLPDELTVATFDRIAQEWPQKRAWIVTAREIELPAQKESKPGLSMGTSR